MDIPYGRSNFEDIRRRGSFYADKTVFLPALESGLTGYPIFLRPRRFGKSTLVSMLEHYYDVAKRDRFDELFKGLWIHEHPTAERNGYLVLTLDFSAVTTDGGPDELRASFYDVVLRAARAFLHRYRDLIQPLGEIDRSKSAQGVLGDLLDCTLTTPHKMYVLIDEYDHFANRLLAGGAQDVYEAVVQKTGFVRTFFAALKVGTRTGAVARVFITGVSPIMLDDLSSGFNIATNISTSLRFNTLAGLTRADTERAVDLLLSSYPHLAALPEIKDRAALFATLERYYNGYRFCPEASERVYNPDMVLYFLRELAERGQLPRTMLDVNVRTEYRHLHIFNDGGTRRGSPQTPPGRRSQLASSSQTIGALAGTGAAERRALLSTIVSEGHIRSDLVDQFGISSLASRSSFLSLLYYLGMLTLGTAARDTIGYSLEIPNRVIRELQWEHLALTLRDEAKVTLNVDALQEALGRMAVEGDIEPFLALFHAHVLKVISNRDTRGLDEKTLKLLLMTYASLGRAFYPLSEAEFAQGYGDLFLGASRDVAGAKFSWLLELKYVKAGAKPAHIEAAFAEAEAQVERYAADPTLLPMLLGDRQLKAGMLVFVGAKKVLFRPWQREARSKRAHT